MFLLMQGACTDLSVIQPPQTLQPVERMQVKLVTWFLAAASPLPLRSHPDLILSPGCQQGTQALWSIFSGVLSDFGVSITLAARCSALLAAHQPAVSIRELRRSQITDPLLHAGPDPRSLPQVFIRDSTPGCPIALR